MTRTLRLAVIALLVPLAAGCRTTPPPAAIETGDWTCPMHPDVLEARAGACPQCRMSLVRIRLETIWSCPLHAVVAEASSGTCPICARDLVRIPVSVTWGCTGRPELTALEPGTCPDGTAKIVTRTLRPHGNHAPQHGGQFFMADDNWHHLEGTHPEPGIFRLHVYDDYSRPLPAVKMRLISGTVASGDRTVPLVLSRDGQTFEAALPHVADSTPTRPRTVTAIVRFAHGGKSHRFDFTFAAPLNEPSPPPAAAKAVAPPVPLPQPVIEIIEQLHHLDSDIGALIASGGFDEVWKPAFAAKDLALTLDEEAGTLPPRTRARTADAIATLVQAAWRLDGYGDLGNRELLQQAHARFTGAIVEISRLLGTHGATTSSATGTDDSMRVPDGSATGVTSQ